MVKPLLQDPHDPITHADLERFEKQIDARLPDDYRAFLLEHNGGDFPNEVAFEHVDKWGRSDPFSVSHLYGLCVKTHGLEDTYRDLDTYLPKGFVPIGGDAGGNKICIVASGRDVGSVWFWDHEAGMSYAWPPENSERICSSFAKFLNGIVYHPEFSHWDETISAFIAAEQGDAGTLTRLLNEGFNIESDNDGGQTLLVCAASNRQSQIVRLLLGRGVDVDARDYQQRTALFWAACHHSFDSVKRLVEAGANLEASDEDGDTPLLVGVYYGYRVPLFLIASGANVNAVNKKGETPLSRCGNYAKYLRPALIAAGATE